MNAAIKEAGDRIQGKCCYREQSRAVSASSASAVCHRRGVRPGTCRVAASLCQAVAAVLAARSRPQLYTLTHTHTPAPGCTLAGKVKVTAFDALEPAQLAPGTCDALVFPSGWAFRGLPLAQLPAAVVASLSGGDAAVAAVGGEQLPGTTLFVCCHAARDERCGHVGPPLADKLAQLLGQNGAEGAAARVLMTSHVGGHKVRWAGQAAASGHIAAGWTLSGHLPSTRCTQPSQLAVSRSSRLCIATAVRRECTGVQPGGHPHAGLQRRLVWGPQCLQRRRLPGCTAVRQGECKGAGAADGRCGSQLALGSWAAAAAPCGAAASRMMHHAHPLKSSPRPRSCCRPPAALRARRRCGPGGAAGWGFPRSSSCSTLMLL